MARENKKRLVHRQFLIFGLAVLALATVPSQKTGASAPTVGFPSPNTESERSTCHDYSKPFGVLKQKTECAEMCFK